MVISAHSPRIDVIAIHSDGVLELTLLQESESRTPTC